MKTPLKLLLVTIMLCLLWISYNGYPVIPIGFIIALKIIFKVRTKLLLSAMTITLIFGFLGTGLYLNIKNTDSNFGFGVALNYGFSNYNTLFDKPTIEITSKKPDINITNNKRFISKVIKSYNTDQIYLVQNFKTSSIEDKTNLIKAFYGMKETYGTIEKYDFIGYKKQNIPNGIERYEIYYKTSLSKTKEFDSFQVSLYITPQKTIVTEIFFIKIGTEYILK